MTGFGRYLVFGAIITIIMLVPLSFAETTCTKNGCDITITLNMAFAGADNAYINRSTNEIESFWNGPNGFRPVGDCKCKLTVKVNAITAVDCKNNTPAGYHCIDVTKFFTPNGAAYDNPPRNQTNITGAAIYVGYMDNITQGNGGNSGHGWWSDQMSRPVNPANPGGQHYNDFAHEAGHMMGLGHNNDSTSIMNNTLANQPNQADLDGAAKAICGDNYCPDSCCCGNGVVDKNKGENCDPKATPNGCGPGASCCPVCCNCYSPMCIAANGEYLSLGSCQASCGPDSSCYKNYKTGCWDCLKQTVVVTGTCRDSAFIRGNELCDHIVRSIMDEAVRFYSQGVMMMPVIGGAFSDERVNIVLAEGNQSHVVTAGGVVTDYGDGLLEEPTMTMKTDRETIRLVAGAEMTPRQALGSGRLIIEGNNIGSSLKLGAYMAALWVYGIIDPPGEFVEPAGDQDLPAEYYEEMGGLNGGQPPAPPPTDVGVPDVYMPE